MYCVNVVMETVTNKGIQMRSFTPILVFGEALFDRANYDAPHCIRRNWRQKNSVV